MFNTLKKLRPNRLPFSTGTFSIPKKSPLLHLNTKTHFASTEGHQELTQIPQVEENSLYSGDFERLISRRIPDGIDTEETRKELEKFLLESHKSPRERRAEKLKNLQETYGPNFKHMAEAKYQVVVDALKSFSFCRETRFSFQQPLDSYKFDGNVDYQVLDRNDEVKALSRMSYVELNNGFIRKKFKHVLKEDEHFSKYENEYYAEDYLKDKPENFVAVFNFPKNSTAKDLVNEFSRFGKIKSYYLRRAFINSPASFEVLYEDKDSALAAKAEMNQRKQNGTTLYVRTIEDAEYEHPVNRTLAIQGIDPSLSFQEVIEILNQHGNVMHFEMPVVQETTKLPTRDELDYYIRHNNVSENGKFKINIKNKKYNVDDWQLKHETVLEENILESKDSRPYFTDAEAMQKDMKPIVSQQAQQVLQQNEEYYKKFFGDPNAKTFEVADTSAFQINKLNPHTEELLNRRDEPSLQYYLKTIQDIKNGTDNSTVSLNDRSGITNFVERPTTYNLGYCFVTFSNTNEAKKALLEVSIDQDLGKEIEVVLKKDQGHIDFDPQYFVKNYEEIRTKSFEEKGKKEDLERTIRDKGGVNKTIQDYRKTAFDGDFEKGLLDYPIKDDKIQPKRQPEEWIKYFEEEEQNLRSETKKKLDDLFEKETEAQFSKRGQVEVNIEEDQEEIDYKLGRSYSSNIGEKEWSNFERALQNRRGKKTDELSYNKLGERERNAYEELLHKKRVIEEGGYVEDSKNLRKERIQLEAKSEDFQLENFLQYSGNQEAIIEAHERRKMFQALRKNASAAKFEEANKRGAQRKEEEASKKSEENQYFDPFKQHNKTKTQEPVNVPAQESEVVQRQKFIEKKEKYLKEVKKVYTGKYTEEEMEDYIEKARHEKKEHNKLRPFFMETDKDGNEYLSKEDERDFEEESLPEDPIERAEALKRIENFKRMKEQNWFKEWEKNKEMIQPVFNTMMLHGFPVESYKFEPSEDCPTIDELVDKLRGQDSVYNYEKSQDENGDEVVIKVMKHGNGWDPSADVSSVDELNSLAMELQNYLRENGIPEEELEYTPIKGGAKELFEMYNQRKPPTEVREVDMKIIELLMKKFPAHFVEKMLTMDPFKEFEDNINELAQYNGLKESVDEIRAMTKEDFVKYSSMTLNPKGNDGKMKKSKYDTF